MMSFLCSRISVANCSPNYSLSSHRGINQQSSWPTSTYTREDLSHSGSPLVWDLQGTLSSLQMLTAPQGSLLAAPSRGSYIPHVSRCRIHPMWRTTVTLLNSDINDHLPGSSCASVHSSALRNQSISWSGRPLFITSSHTVLQAVIHPSETIRQIGS